MPLEGFSPQQITTIVVTVCGLIGLRVLAPLFGLVNASRGETKAQYLAQIQSNKEEIADLKADNRKLHERMGEQASEQRQMVDQLGALKTEVQYVKAANASLLTDNARLEATNVSLQLALVKAEGERTTEVRIRDHRIQALEDEVDEQLVYQDKPTKYERLRNPAGTPKETEASPRRFDTPSSTPVTVQS
jgi:regulator of replication initiation timing